MSELLSVVRDILINFLVYGLLANILVMAISELLGDQLRFKMRFYRKKIVKWLKNTRLELIAVSKPIGLNIGESVDEVVRKLRDALHTKGITSATQGSSIVFEVAREITAVRGQISLAFQTPDHVEAVELTLRFPVDYQRFADNFINLVDTIETLQDVIRTAYSFAGSFSDALQCIGLNKAYELNGVLRKHELEALSSRRKDGIELNLMDREVTVYGRMGADLKNLVLDLVTYYY